jgi:hypothetical protein
MNGYKERRILSEKHQSLATAYDVPASGANNAQERAPVRASSSSALLIAGAVVLLLGIAGISLVKGRNTAVPTPPPQPTIAVATSIPVVAAPLRETVVIVATLTPVPTPGCISTLSELASLDSLIQQAKYEQATAKAEDALNIHGLCHNEIQLLTSRAVLAGLYALYNQEFDPLDAKAHQAAVDTFLRLRERARLAGIAFPASLLQVANEARRISQHRLTITAIELAFSEGEFNPELDREVTRLYISGLYGLGYWYTKAEQGSELYSEGLSYLIASHQLAVKFKTGQAEAGNLLRQLSGNDEARWLAPYLSPLLTND